MDGWMLRVLLSHIITCMFCKILNFWCLVASSWLCTDAAGSVQWCDVKCILYLYKKQAKWNEVSLKCISTKWFVWVTDYKVYRWCAHPHCLTHTLLSCQTSFSSFFWSISNWWMTPHPHPSTTQAVFHNLWATMFQQEAASIGSDHWQPLLTRTEHDAKVKQQTGKLSFNQQFWVQTWGKVSIRTRATVSCTAAQLLSCCRWPSVENGWYFIKLLISTKIRIRSWHTGLGHLSCWSWFVGILILFKMYRIKCSAAVLQGMGEIWVYNQSVCQSLMPSIMCTVNMVELEKELRLVTS